MRRETREGTEGEAAQFRRSRVLGQQNATALIVAAIVAFLVIIPTTFLVFGSFWSSSLGLKGTFTVGNYATIFGSSLTYKALLNTFLYSLGATIEAVIIGAPLAWLVTRTNTPFSGFFEAASLVPYMIPGILYAVGWTFLMDPTSGLIPTIMSRGLGLPKLSFNIYSLGGMIVVDGLTGVPLVVVLLAIAFRNQDYSLEESASIMGSGPLGVLRRITLPLVTPAIVAAFLLNILRYWELFEVPAIIGLRGGVYVLSTLIYGQIVGSSFPNFGYAAALGVITVLVSVWLVYLYRRSARRSERFAVIGGKASRPRLVELGRWRYATSVFCLTTIFISSVLPILALVLGSVLQYWGTLGSQSLTAALSQATLSHYYFAFSFPIVRRAFVNSIFLAVGGATLCIILSLFVGYMVAKTNLKGNSILEVLAFTPFAVPGVVLGVGLLWAYALMPLQILGTIWVLLLAYITKFMPYGVRSITSSVVQIHRELEEASRVSGGSWLRTIRKIVIPILRPAIMGGWILLAIIFLREVSTSILLYQNGTEVLSVVVYALFNDNQWEAVSAIGVVMVGVSLALSLIARKVAKMETVAVA